MNIPGLIQKYAGQSLSFDGIEANRGQCVQWVEYVLTDKQFGYGLQPFWGNAIDWWNNFPGSNLAKDFDRVTYGGGSYPKAGDIVIWGSGVGSIYGHIDLCTQDGNPGGFVGYDSNWSGKTVHQVNHNYTAVIGGLRLKGSNMPITEDNLYSLIRAMTRREPTVEEVSNPAYLNDPDLAIATFWNNGGKDLYNRGVSPLNEDEFYMMVRGITRRDPTVDEAKNLDYRHDANLAIRTFWQNIGKNLFGKDTPTPITKDQVIQYIKDKLS